jgi:hypothetical protein
MPLLNAEQMEEFKNRMNPTISEPEPVSATGEEEEPKTEETQEVSAAEQEPEEEGHSVPYKRFKKVIESRNELKSEIAELRKQVDELRSMPKQTEKEFEKSYREAEQEYEDALQDLLDPSTKQLKSLEERMFQFEVAQEKVKLNQELASIRNDYPDVPEQLILEAIIKDSSVDARAVAEQYSLFITQVEEQGIARYVKQNGSQQETTKAAPAVPKRLSGHSGATADRAHFGGVEKPKTLKGAQAAVLQFLKRNNL